MDKSDIVNSGLIKQFGSFFDEYKTEIGIILVIVLFYFLKEKKVFSNNLSDKLFENTYYVNLEHRKDRNENTIKELNKFGIKNPKRFNAIKDDIGSVGCSKSHLKCLEIAKDNNWDYVAIFEDDVTFLKPEETLLKLNNILKSKIDWDVILLGGNNSKPYTRINDDCIRVKNCQCCTSYIVKKSYYNKLIDHWKDGLQKLIKTKNSSKYTIDQYWKILQKQDIFLLITPLNVIQREDYSDIEKKKVNYKNVMLNHY